MIRIPLQSNMRVKLILEPQVSNEKKLNRIRRVQKCSQTTADTDKSQVQTGKVTINLGKVESPKNREEIRMLLNIRKIVPGIVAGRKRRPREVKSKNRRMVVKIPVIREKLIVKIPQSESTKLPCMGQLLQLIKKSEKQV